MSNDSGRINKQKIQVGDSYILPIEQSKVTMSQAKVKQIMAETDAQTRQMVTAAENKSQIIVETANTEATRIIEEARKKGEQEFEEIKNKAYNEGFEKGQQDGLEKFKQDAEAGLQSLETLAKSSYDMKKNIIDSATRDIIDLITVIAEKVCHYQMDEQMLYDITTDAIRQLNDKEKITIIVNPGLIENINRLVPSFQENFPTMQSIKILEDSSLSVDGVIVETPSSRLDSRISSQIAELAQKMITGADNELE